MNKSITFLEARAASSAKVLSSARSKVDVGTCCRKFRVKSIEANTKSAEETRASLVSAQLLLFQADAVGIGTVGTTLAGNGGDTQVKAVVHPRPVCLGHIDARPHSIPLFGASVVFTGVDRGFAANTRRIFVG